MKHISIFILALLLSRIGVARTAFGPTSTVSGICSQENGQATECKYDVDRCIADAYAGIANALIYIMGGFGAANPICVAQFAPYEERFGEAMEQCQEIKAACQEPFLKWQPNGVCLLGDCAAACELEYIGSLNTATQGLAQWIKDKAPNYAIDKEGNFVAQGDECVSGGPVNNLIEPMTDAFDGAEERRRNCLALCTSPIPTAISKTTLSTR